MGFRDYYDKSFGELLEEELNHQEFYYADMEARKRLRMYANLFCRDMRKTMLNESSCCVLCGAKDKLSIDHKVPVIKGGANSVNNVQILCMPCNLKKRANE